MRNAWVYLFLLPLLSGCYMKGQIEDLSKIIVLKNPSSELNSGSKSVVVTTGNYNVSYTVGDVFQTIETKTADGYIVNAGVQAAMISEETEENYFNE